MTRFYLSLTMLRTMKIFIMGNTIFLRRRCMVLDVELPSTLMEQFICLKVSLGTTSSKGLVAGYTAMEIVILGTLVTDGDMAMAELITQLGRLRPMRDITRWMAIGTSPRSTMK